MQKFQKFEIETTAVAVSSATIVEVSKILKKCLKTSKKEQKPAVFAHFIFGFDTQSYTFFIISTRINFPVIVCFVT